MNSSPRLVSVQRSSSGIVTLIARALTSEAASPLMVASGPGVMGPMPADDLAGRVPGEAGQRGQRLLLTAGGVGHDQAERPPAGVQRGVQGAHRDVDRVALGDTELLVPDGLRAGA